MQGHLENLRRLEIETVKGWLIPGAHVLELGGGNGFQASVIRSLGCEVMSVDLAASNELARPNRFFPVQVYDGEHIPANDGTFDIIFSSNVLEHVRNLGALFGEMRRVLRPDGLAIHILPSTSWRFWQSVAYAGFLVKSLLGRQRYVPGTASAPITSADVTQALRTRGLAYTMKKAVLFPLLAHGEYPNAIAELYYYSIRRWIGVFEDHGFSVEEVAGTNLFYTGHVLFPDLSYRIRRQMSHLLGSACHVFVMRN